ncbi:hypothetical protein AMS68_004670 [Peltaster fructicola]|uniref:Small ribosomal subunit protein mS37 n=1 Tax=Peltaster fructicola TaxID=286661 RepID=A0A6H0XWM5_9PEZI|nr:hypothetical protein AMS68_004670 [Peltaster fructicola]
MVLGKNTQQSVKRATTAKLPPLKALRVRRPDTQQTNPCVGIMASVLGCWASSGYTSQGCAVLEQSLRACMDAKRPQEDKKNKINSHLSRFYPMMKGAHKRK